MDVQECDDGTFVSRDPANGCAFKACPKVCTGEDGETYMAPCEGMDGMFCIGESYTALDGCNTCSCGNMDGIAACTAMACPPKPEESQTVEAPKVCTGEDGETYMAPCEGMDGMFCIGESYIALDGCNTCSCGNMDGLAKCTMMACPPKPEDQTVEAKGDEAATTCLVNGLEIEVGQEYTPPDGCNTCTCTDTGDSACTRKACEPCSTCDGDDGNTYCAGEVFLSGDGCNTCRCGENGAVPCTKMACLPEEGTQTKDMDTMSAADTCLVNGLEIEAGETYVAADGCNTCTCSGGDAPDACTMMACAEPCSTCEDGSETYCAGVSYLSSDGCNTCTCTENGVSACTLMACPPMESDSTSDDVATCVIRGITYEEGETYVADDGCNTCTCSGGDAPDACTMMACAEPCSTCEDGSETYCAGVSYLSSDGCNTCTCNEDGVSACTMMACPDSPAPEGMKDDTTSGAISASVGLSAIVAIGSFLIIICV